MSLNYRSSEVTAEQYAAIFAREREQVYLVIDEFEARIGYAVGRDRLEHAARVLCCPFKAVPPNWQHGRVIYAMTRKRLSELPANETVRLIDVGTAKGFSAVAAQWALDDSGLAGSVTSVDVLPPSARVRRNTQAEVDALKTLDEIVAPYPEAQRIVFLEMTGIAVLTESQDRIHGAFIDGKHSTEAVRSEWRSLAERQQSGDIAIFDDVQMPAVTAGLNGAQKAYAFEYLTLDGVNRAYAIGVRR